MKKYKLYIFDLDGTLLDSDQMIIETFKFLYQRYKPTDYKVDEKKLLTFSGPPIKESLLQEFPELDQALILNDWRKESMKNYPIFTKLFPGTTKLLSTLVEKHIPVAIVTNKHREAYEEAIKIFGLDSLKIFSICADEAGAMKPNPDGIIATMKHFNISDKSEVIYIGDSKFDALTACNAGVNFGLVSWSPRKLPKAAKIDEHIKSFEEMAEQL